ncbi:MAG: hypothetical protein WC509_04845 [Candidatus Izemoplasmatales bacterium]
MGAYDLFVKEAFFLVGCDGQGPAGEASEWIPPLWEEFNAGFGKLETLARPDARGRIHVWGAMTDLAQEFQPWGEDGRYMVGVESDRYMDALGFAVWRVPGFVYVRVPATIETYADVYRHTLGVVFAEQGWNLVGAIQEMYLKERMWLLFPIERL